MQDEILKKLHQSNFNSLKLAGLDWYKLVKQNEKLARKYVEYLRKKSEWVVVNTDYSQLEIYVLASLSGDTALINAVNSGLDIHDFNTENVYKISKKEIQKELESAKLANDEVGIKSATFALEDFKTKRKFIKALSFSLSYGAGVSKIASDLKMEISEAQKLIDDFYGTYPKLKEWQDKTFLSAVVNGYIDTPFGRQRATPKIHGRMDAYKALALDDPRAVNALKKAGEYWSLREEQKVCKNTPIQSTATDMCSKAACMVHKWFNTKQRRAKMLFWVHDAIVFTSHIDELVENINMVTNIMETQVKYSGDPVNYRTEAEVGFNYEYVAGIPRNIIGTDAFTKEYIESKLAESLDVDLSKKFKLVIKGTSTAMDTLKEYVEAQKEAKGDYFNSLVERLGITGVSTPEHYMASLHEMTLSEYLEAEETKLDDSEEDE